LQLAHLFLLLQNALPHLQILQFFFLFNPHEFFLEHF
jgi:hypothetical protein